MITLIWLIAGLLLCASEAVVPGLITIFLGLGALGVAGLRWLGLIESLPVSFLVWLASSTALIFALRRTMVRWISPDSSKADIDEARAEFGQRVEVLTDVSDSDEGGRIRFQGTSWPAKTAEGTLKKGALARIVYRENTTYIIEAVDEGRLLEEQNVAARVPEPSVSEEQTT